MKIIYKKNHKLKIFINKKKINFDLNKDQNIDNCKKEFNKIIEKISSGHKDNIHYLTLKIIERNTLVHNLFEDLCLINLIKKYKTNGLEIYTNNVSLFLHFKPIANFTFFTGLYFRFVLVKNYTKPYVSLFNCFLKNLKFYFLYSNKKYRQNLSKKFVFFSVLTSSSFKNGKINDLYNGYLTKARNMENRKVKIMPYLHEIENLKYIIKKIRSKKDRFIVIHDYLNITDYFFIFKNFFYKRKIKFNSKLIFFNINVMNVFNHYLKKESSGIDIFYYKFFEKIQSNNVNFFLHHENNIIEKAIILGIRKFIKKTKIYGFFHMTNPKNLLNHEYTSSNAFEASPKPDVFLFNSNKYKSIFEEKYPRIKGFNFPALKQMYIKNAKNYSEQKKNKVILVILTGDINENKFLLNLLNEPEFKNYQFLFRQHPFFLFDVKKHYKGSNYIMTNDDSLSSKRFLNVGAVISGYSGLLVEFSLRGFPVGLIYQKDSIFKNPFDHTEIKNYVAINSKEKLIKFFKKPLFKKSKNNFFNLKKEISAKIFK